MRLKDGVDLTGVSWRMFHAAVVAEAVYAKYNAELVITSARDGKHSARSLHYEGLALDLRTRSLMREDVPRVVADMKAALGDDYDVVLESDHIHLEFDPS